MGRRYQLRMRGGYGCASQISTIKARANILSLHGDTEEVVKLQGQLDKLQANRTAILDKILGGKAGFDNIKTQLEGLIGFINHEVDIKAMDKTKADDQIRYINQLLKDTERQMGIVEYITKQTTEAFTDLKDEIDKVNASLAKISIKKSRKKKYASGATDKRKFCCNGSKRPRGEIRLQQNRIQKSQKKSHHCMPNTWGFRAKS